MDEKFRRRSGIASQNEYICITWENLGSAPRRNHVAVHTKTESLLKKPVLCFMMKMQFCLMTQIILRRKKGF